MYVQHVNGCIRLFIIKIIFPQFVSAVDMVTICPPPVVSCQSVLICQVRFQFPRWAEQSDSLANVRAGSESGLAGCVMPSVARFGLAAQLSFKNPLFEPVQPPSRASRASCQGRYIFRFQSCNFPEVGLMWPPALRCRVPVGGKCSNSQLFGPNCQTGCGKSQNMTGELGVFLKYFKFWMQNKILDHKYNIRWSKI